MRRIQGNPFFTAHLTLPCDDVIWPTSSRRVCGCLLTPPPQGRKARGSCGSEGFHTHLCALRLCLTLLRERRTDRRQGSSLCRGSLHTHGATVPRWKPAGDQMLVGVVATGRKLQRELYRSPSSSRNSCWHRRASYQQKHTVCCDSADVSRAMRLRWSFHVLRTWGVNLK